MNLTRVQRVCAVIHVSLQLVVPPTVYGGSLFVKKKITVEILIVANFDSRPLQVPMMPSNISFVFFYIADPRSAGDHDLVMLSL